MFIAARLHQGEEGEEGDWRSGLGDKNDRGIEPMIASFGGWLKEERCESGAEVVGSRRDSYVQRVAYTAESQQVSKGLDLQNSLMLQYHSCGNQYNDLTYFGSML